MLAGTVPGVEPDRQRPVYDEPGWCPVCSDSVRFVSSSHWYRDDLLCSSCQSIPRERAVALVLAETRPNWRTLQVLESSPADRGVSRLLRLEGRGYVGTQWNPDTAAGELDEWGYRNENLESLTFGDCSFDVVVTLDVMEHVNEPAACFGEIARVLRPGGVYIFSVPTDEGRLESERAASYRADGTVEHYREPEYHGNPLGDSSLVTWRWGHDLPELIQRWSSLSCRVVRFHDPSHGIIGRFTDVYLCHVASLPKRSRQSGWGRVGRWLGSPRPPG